MLHYTKKMPNIHIISCMYFRYVHERNSNLAYNQTVPTPKQCPCSILVLAMEALSPLDADVKVRGFWYAFLLSGSST